MKIENLRNLPNLVNSMEENLFININDFIENPTIKDLKLNKSKLINVIKTSQRFNYDHKSSTIKIKEKADRNMLIVKSLITADMTPEDISNKKAYLESLIMSCRENIRIVKIERILDDFHVVFEHEDISMEIEQYIIKNKSDMSVSLAAESFKRRIMSNLNPKFSSLWSQIQFISSLVINENVIKPRRLTDVNLKSNFYNNKDKTINITETNHSLKSKSPEIIINNKYDEAELINNSVKNFGKSKIMHSLSLDNQFNTKFKIQNFSGRMSFNKYDINLLNQNSRKLSSFNSKNKIVKDSSFNEKRKISIISNYSSNYFDPRESLKSIDPIIEIPYYREYSNNINILSENIDIKEDSNDDYKNFIKCIKEKRTYLNKEIFSVFYHLKYLKSFEIIPEGINNNFVKEIMKKEPKTDLECSKIQNQFNKRLSKSGILLKHIVHRSNTFMETNSKFMRRGN